MGMRVLEREEWENGTENVIWRKNGWEVITFGKGNQVLDSFTTPDPREDINEETVFKYIRVKLLEMKDRKKLWK